MITRKLQTDSLIEEYNTLVSGLAQVINSLQKVNDMCGTRVFRSSGLERHSSIAPDVKG